MEEYELELTPKDIGDIIELIRVSHLRLHSIPFAEKLGMKENVLTMTEEGRGPHGVTTLKKIAEKFPNRVKVSINVKLIN